MIITDEAISKAKRTLTEIINPRKISVVTVFMIARIHRDKRTCERVGQWSDLSGRPYYRQTDNKKGPRARSR